MKLPRWLRWRTEHELSEEIQSHLDIETQANVERGLSPDDARYAALRQFGNRTRLEERTREGDPLFSMETVARDILYAIRSLRRNPGFTAAATISLALGIGANTLIFSLLDSTLLKPLAFPDPNRLAVIWTVPAENPSQAQTASISTYFAFRDRASSFESVGAYNGAACGQGILGADQDGAPAERILGQTLSPSLFRSLGVKPLMGRTFTDEEDQVDNVAPVVVISHGMWQRRFAGDPAVVGKTLTLNSAKSTVIGVMPANFVFFGDQVEFFLPLCLTGTQVLSRVGGNTIVGRLKPGISIKQAQSEVDTISAQLAASDQERHKGLGARVEALQSAAYGAFRSPLLLLQGAVAFVLLIACANVAGLLLARAASRRTEVAVRGALGAGRGRIVRQLLAESFPLSALGGVVGLLLAWGGLKLFLVIAPANFPRLHEITVDMRVLGFTALVVLLTSVIFAVVPAIQTSKLDLLNSLKESSRSGTEGTGHQYLRRALVTGQIALALLLLISAGLMINSFIRIQKQDLGADPKNLLTFDFRWPISAGAKPAGKYRGVGLWDVSPRPGQMFDRVAERLRNVPGVVSAAAVNVPPLNKAGIPLSTSFLIEGRAAPPSSNSASGSQQLDQTANYFAVTPDFFATMRVPLVRGRDFNDRDTAEAPLVMIINQTLARQFFPRENPIGQQVTLNIAPNERPREIIAVVGDTVTTRLEREHTPAVYVPHLQQTSQFAGPLVYFRTGMYFVVRTSGEPMNLANAVKRAVAEVDPNTPVAGLRTLQENLNDQVGNMRIYMLLLGLFGIVSVILAATGIYGVMAYSVAERTREIGIRMALGAGSANVLGMILRQAGVMIAAGVAIGTAGAVSLTGLMQSALYGITPTDPGTYGAVCVLLVLIALLACAIPTRRAVRVDPTIALRS
ncbi:MAG: ABC transporter permease [Acidobacteriia bacterium]|nr:ABC transporter permease [Terriglobia bacterium]